MTIKTIAAIILIAAAVVMFAYQGITYTSREKVVDLGPLQVSAETTKSFPLPPVVGAVLLVGGIILLSVGNRKE